MATSTTHRQFRRMAENMSNEHLRNVRATIVKASRDSGGADVDLGTDGAKLWQAVMVEADGRGLTTDWLEAGEPITVTPAPAEEQALFNAAAFEQLPGQLSL